MIELWRVEYKLDGLDTIPVTLEHPRKKAFEEMHRLLQFHDLIYLKMERL